MTCEECLYKGFCENQYGDTDYFDDETICGDVEKQCGKFKDKSRFIELPCKVGNTVYLLGIDRVIECKVCQYHIHIEKYIPHIMMHISYTSPTDGYVYTELNWTRNKDIRVFLTKEEAEKALQKGCEG